MSGDAPGPVARRALHINYTGAGRGQPSLPEPIEDGELVKPVVERRVATAPR